MIYHSLYLRGQGNSIAGIDLDYTVMKGLNIYGQIVLDEFTGPGEPDGSTASPWRSQKMGYMLGSRVVLPTSAGLFKFSLEGVYTDPYLYLREKYDEASGRYGVSFYGSIKEFQNVAASFGGSSVSYLRNCIGYVYGGDAIVGDFKFAYDSLSRFSAGFEAFYMVHGIMYNDLTEDWIVGKNPTTPTKEDFETTAGGIPVTDTLNKSGESKHLVRVSINGNYRLFDWIEFYGRLDNMIMVNKDHEASKAKYDAQLILGTRITW